MWTWLKGVRRHLGYRGAAGRAGGRDRGRRRRRPGLEGLESRVVPASIVSVSHTDPSMISDTAAGNVVGPASVSADGRFVVYSDTAANLAPGQVMAPLSSYNVFLYDRALATTTLVSHAAGSSVLTADGISKNPVISADGNWIAFVSNSDNLVTETVPAGVQTLHDQYWVFVYHRTDGGIRLVSHQAPDQGPGFQNTLATGSSGIITPIAANSATATTSVSISGDGHYLAYVSTATHLLNGQQSVAAQSGVSAPANVFVYDQATDTNFLVSAKFGSPTNSAGAPNTPGNDTAFSAAIDRNGDTIAYTSFADNLVNGETDPNSSPTEQHYAAKITGATWATFGTALLSHDSTSVTKASTFSTTDLSDYPAPVLTPDGHYVAYVSVNDDIVAPASSSGVVGENVYLCDTSTLGNTLVSHTETNASKAGNADTPAAALGGLLIAAFPTNPAPAVSDDGRYVVFVSDATNLTHTGTPAGNYFTYLFDRLGTVDTTHNNIVRVSLKGIPTLQLPLTSYPPLAPSLSGDGRYIAYVGFAAADVGGVTNVNTLPGSVGCDALLYDQQAQTYSLLSHSYASATTTGTGEAYTPVISDNGSTVLYLDDSDNLLPTTINGHTGQDLNAALPTDGTDLYAYSLNTPSGYTAPAANGTNATVTLTDPGLPSLNANGLSEIAPAHAVSDDGRFVVYSSVSPNTVAGEKDTSLTQNIFLYDKTTQKSTLVSHVAGLPTTTANGLSANAVISGDGTTVVFYSYATNMVSGETYSAGTGGAGNDPELYLYDNNPAHGSTYGTVALISHVTTSETQAANGTLPGTPNGLGASAFASTLLYSNPLLALGLALPAVSANGQYIAYLSNATNLSDTNTGTNKINVFLYDRTSDNNKLVSHASGSATTGNGDASTVAISADGSTVAFTSNATNLLPTSISNGGNDELYVWSRIDNTSGPTGLAEAQTVLASHAAGAPTTAAGFTSTSGTSSWGPLPASLSADGAYVAYYFGGNNLVAGQGGTASPQNVFVYVVPSNFNALLSHVSGSIATAGDNPANPNLYEASGPVISADGRYVAYANNSTNLLPTPLTGQNGRDNVYLYDGAQPDPTKQNVLVSHADGQANTPDSGGGTAPYLSANGSTVSFVDLALDSNPDPMAIEPAASARVFATAAPPGAATTIVGGVFDPSPLVIVGATLAPTELSADGLTLVWDGPASDVAPVPGDRNSNIDVFLAVSPQPPAHLTITGGNNQNITVGQGPGTALTVSVSDTNNNPVGGVTVTFTINGNTTTGASGTFNTGPQTTATAVTDSNGNATVPGFTANTQTGGWTITASTPGTNGLLTATFNLTNVPDKPANITVTGGTPQSTVVGHAFPNPMTVQLTDQYNNPEPSGVNVTFTIGTSTTGASGTFPGGGTSVTVQTDSTGTATVPTVTANTITGTYTLTGTTPGVNQTATFTLTNTPDVPFAITASSGTPQTTTVNTTFTNPLQAQVTDQYGNTEGSGITVTFTAPTSGPSGTFNGTATVTTDSNGIATSPTITANTTAGGYTVTATTSGVGTDASFSLTNTPDKPAQITAIAGTPQSATVNTAFATALEAKVTDQYGNAEPSVTVTFAAPTSGASGTFNGTATVTTDSSGVATAPTFTANTTAGSYTVTASTAGVSPDASFSLTNTPDKPAGFVVLDGSNQSATVGTAFGTALQVKVVDQYGNAEPAGVTVTFTAPASGPSGTFTGSATVTTDASGVATAPTFTANTIAGSYTVTASTSGVGTDASFSLTNTPDKPAQISAILGTPQSATVNTQFATALEVKLTDQYGNAEPAGVTVSFAAPGSGASGTFGGNATVTTDASGVATAPTFTANTTAGSYTVTASTAGVSPDASFSLTNTPDKPASVVVTDGSGQSAVVTNTFAKPLSVLVTDQYGNPEPAGITVSFAAPGSGASGTFANGSASLDVTTASDGTAASSAFTANTVAGGYAVTASVTGAKPGTFSLTNTPGPASSISVDSGSGQSATVGNAFGSGLTILLTDQYGNPEQAAYTVTFTINAGTNGASGTFSGGGTSALVQTNSSGTATSPTVIANTVAGTFTVTATVSGVNGSATFQLTNNPGPTSNIIVVSGSPQSATVNTAFGAALEVKLTDQYGNAEPAGVTVTFTAPTSGPSGTFAGGAGSVDVSTASDGTATAPTFTANTVAGSYAVTPSVTGVSSSASFALTNTADTAAALVVVAGSPQSTQVTTAFATALEVKVTDQYGNAEGGGITVTFTAPTSGPSGTFTGGAGSAQVTTASDGTATAPTFTANTVAGGYTVSAASAGIKPDASFSLTNTPASAAHITVLDGNPQSATIYQPYTAPLAVMVTDTYGNPVAPGTSVTFTAPGSGPSGTFKGSGTSAVVGTDAKGNATAPDFTANATPGPFTVTASVAGGSAPAAFSLDNLPVDNSVVYVNPDWAGTPPGADPDGPGPATVFGPGGNAFANLDDANANVKPGGTIVIEGGTYSGPVDVNNAGLIILAGDVTLDTGGSSTDFKPPIVGQTSGADSLTINAGGGDVTFEKPIGDPALDNLTINGAHNVTFESTLDLTGNLTETGGTGTTLLGGGVVGGAVSIAAANIALEPGTLKAGSVTLDASGAVNVPAGATITATGNVVLDGGFNNPAGGSVTLGGVVTGAGVSLLGGPGPDTFTITKDSGPITVDGEGGANQLNVDTSAISPGQILIVTAQTITDNGLGGPITYKANGGTFGHGVNVTTGLGNDIAVVESTQAGAPTFINTGNGDDSLYVSSSTNLAAGVISGLAGPLTLDAGAGKNGLVVSEAAATTADTVFITGAAIGTKNAPNAIWYKATGGGFAGVIFIGGSGNDGFVILSTFPGAPTTVYGNGGNDTFDVGATPSTAYQALTLDGGAGVDTLGVYDVAGGAAVSQFPSGPGIGQVTVKYPTGKPSSVSYQNMDQVGSNVSQDQSFIQALYQTELGFAASASDVNFWLNVLNGPGGRQAVVDGIDRSQPALTRLTASWYRTYLGRSPVNGEEQALVARLQAGETEESVLASLLSSDEYVGLAGGSDSGFVQRLFAQLLGRPASPDEVSGYVGALIPQVGRNGAAWLVLTSTEHRRLAVAAEYAQLLHRTGLSLSDLDYWAAGPLDLLSIHESLEQTPDFLAANG